MIKYYHCQNQMSRSMSYISQFLFINRSHKRTASCFKTKSVEPFLGFDLLCKPKCSIFLAYFLHCGVVGRHKYSSLCLLQLLSVTHRLLVHPPYCLKIEQNPCASTNRLQVHHHQIPRNGVVCST